MKDEPDATRKKTVGNERKGNEVCPGVGIDIVEVDRVDTLLTRHGDRFLQKVFTPGEIAYAAGRRRMAESLAGRFAAKEAFMKALGRRLPWKDVEIVMRGQRPAVMYGGATYYGVSLSHERAFAVAVVIAGGHGPVPNGPSFEGAA